MAGVGSDHGELLLSRAARTTGCNQIAERLGYSNGGPYLYVVALVGLDLGGLSVLQYLHHGYHPVLALPYWFVPPLAVFGTTWTTRRLVEVHDAVVEQFAADADDPDPLCGPLAPLRLQAATYLAVLAVGVLYYAQPAVRSSVLALEGWLFPAKFLVLFAGLYYLAVAEVVAVVIGMNVRLPRRFVRAGVELDFGDRSRLGGFGPVGKLLRRSTQLYFVGLFVYTLVVFVPPALASVPLHDPGTLLSVAFLGAWLGGFALFLIPMTILHREMKRQKEERLERLHARLLEHGRHDESVPDRPPDDDVLGYLYFHVALTRVERTREYPTDATLLRDVGVSSLPSMLTYLATLLPVSARLLA